MDITFVNHTTPKVTALGTISFQAIVDGDYLWCEISFEALRDTVSLQNSCNPDRNDRLPNASGARYHPSAVM